MVQSKPCVASIQAEIDNPMKQRILNEMAITLNFLDGLFIWDRTFGYFARFEKCNLIVPGHQAIGLDALKFICTLGAYAICKGAYWAPPKSPMLYC